MLKIIVSLPPLFSANLRVFSLLSSKSLCCWKMHVLHLSKFYVWKFNLHIIEFLLSYYWHTTTFFHSSRKYSTVSIFTGSHNIRRQFLFIFSSSSFISIKSFAKAFSYFSISYAKLNENHTFNAPSGTQILGANEESRKNTWNSILAYVVSWIDHIAYIKSNEMYTSS